MIQVATPAGQMTVLTKQNRMDIALGLSIYVSKCVILYVLSVSTNLKLMYHLILVLVDTNGKPWLIGVAAGPAIL